jgi:hypothetical protein
MSPTGRKTAKLFLADYTTDENFLIRPNRDHGRPGLLQAREPQAATSNRFGGARYGSFSGWLRCRARRTFSFPC